MVEAQALCAQPGLLSDWKYHHNQHLHQEVHYKTSLDIILQYTNIY
jgi:hypothetical protein